MKKYNMPTMELSLFDAEVVSTSEVSKMSEDLTAFNSEMEAIKNNGGLTRAITWEQLNITW